MNQIAENLWTLHYKLPLLGEYLGRNVTIIRLGSGDLVIHSTGPFTPEDVAAIKALGRPAYLVEAYAQHDTFAKEGQAAFPDIPYLAPEGFAEAAGVQAETLHSTPEAWGDELLSLELAGKSSGKEYVFFHRPSRTLIVADLVFNVEDDAPLGAKMASILTVGLHHSPGVPRPEKLNVEDEDAFSGSLDTMMSWDFDRVITGHGELIETGGKARLQEAFKEAGFYEAE